MWNATEFEVRCLNSPRVCHLAAKLGLGVFHILRIHVSQIWMGPFFRNGKRTWINKIERPIVHGRFDRLKDFPVSFDAEMIFLFTKKPNQNTKSQPTNWTLGHSQSKSISNRTTPKIREFRTFFIWGDPGAQGLPNPIWCAHFINTNRTSLCSV